MENLLHFYLLIVLIAFVTHSEKLIDYLIIKCYGKSYWTRISYFLSLFFSVFILIPLNILFGFLIVFTDKDLSSKIMSMKTGNPYIKEMQNETIKKILEDESNLINLTGMTQEELFDNLTEAIKQAKNKENKSNEN